ncbi:unknown [Clostridium sp. CAG:306]|nr:unknown [Clostridium sp. CAG:306]
MYPLALMSLEIVILPEPVVERSISLPAIISPVSISSPMPFKTTEPAAFACKDPATKSIAWPVSPILPAVLTRFRLSTSKDFSILSDCVISPLAVKSAVCP